MMHHLAKETFAVQAGFKAALGLMQMDATVCEEEWSKTPVCKKPRSLAEVTSGLVSTPPPVLGPQSVTCPKNIGMHDHTTFSCFDQSYAINFGGVSKVVFWYRQSLGSMGSSMGQT